MSITLHLMTQRGQPYGSVRRCCERCGLMLVARPLAFWDAHAYADKEVDYRDDHEGFETCERKKEQS